MRSILAGVSIAALLFGSIGSVEAAARAKHPTAPKFYLLPRLEPFRAQVSATVIVVGSTPVIGCSNNGYNLYNNNGIVGCQAAGGGGGTGTVTSAGMTITGGILSVSGSPITTSGTFAVTLAGTSGGIPYFSSTTGWASSALLAANALVVGGGVGLAPSTVTTGANVLTALSAAINATTGLPNVDGAITTGDCLKWGPGVEDAGGACGGSVTAGAGIGVTGSTVSLGDGVGITYTGQGQLGLIEGTITTNLPALNTTVTWNNGAQVFDAPWKLNVTPTAFAAGSLLADLQVSSASKFVVTETGYIIPAAYGANVIGIANTNTNDLLLGNAGTNYSVLSASSAFGTSTASGWKIAGTGTFCWSSGTPTSNCDTGFTRHGAAAFQLGQADAAAPVAQTLGSQSVVAGTSNTAGATLTINGSVSTGSGTSGDIVFKTGGTGAAATVQNSEVAALTIKGATQAVQMNSATYANCGALSTSSNVIGCGAGPVPLTTGGSGSLTGSYGYYVCTTTCSITLPTPAAGDQFCVRNDSAVTTVITIAAITSVQFEKTTYNGYGTVTTGTMVSGGALGDKVCLIGRDATHYLVGSFVGTWTNS
jgi:hypothetical protein